MTTRTFTYLLSLTLPLSANEPDPLNQQAKQLSEQPMPLVFRSVLNKRPRMLTIQLDKHHAIAYDTWHPQLALAWQVASGPLVKFDGAVYTGSHGPQPTTLGSIQLDNANPEFSSTLGSVHFIAHTIRDNKPSLKFAVRDAQHRVVATITETPQWDGKKLQRSLSVTPQTQGASITFSPASAKPWTLGKQTVKSITLAEPITITTSL